MRFDGAQRYFVAVLGVLFALALAAYAVVAASLPRRSGAATLPGLTAALTIELDARAIPRIRATSFADALRGQGYMHAQERFLQMDLLRRAAAGELAELFGERAFGADAAQRAFEFRARARRLLDDLPAEQLAWLDAYTQGVNAGLADLGARPLEYWLIGARPTPWREEDSLLAVYAFYTLLSNNESYERPQGVLHATLPAALYDFLTPSTSRFDRPLVRDAADPTGGYTPLTIPGPEIIDLRGSSRPPSGNAPRIEPPLLGPASNQWAVDTRRGAGGRALVANDPHLGLRIPNVFYRSELEWPGGAVRGVGIPGFPGILIGANAALAWGATVSNADQSDWVVVELDPSDASRYRTPDGFEAFRVSMVDVTVAGRAAPARIEIRATRWGPVVARDWLGRPLVLHATWLEPGGMNLNLLTLANAQTIDAGLGVLASWSGPSLNWVLADDRDIGWVVNGPLPQRRGYDGSRPESWADGSRAWQGYAPSPIVRGGADGTLFTANNRTLPRAQADALSRMWMRPLRAKRIDDLLAVGSAFDEHDFLAMQLDTLAEGYEQIRAAVLETVPADEQEPLLSRARQHVQGWNGRADIDQPGFRLLHAYYRALLERTLAPLLAAAVAAEPELVYRWPLADEVLRRLLEERPAHFLTREHASWPAFLRSVLLETLQALERDGAGVDTPWGEVNVLDVRHPFATQPLLAPLARWLELPRSPLPGSTLSLRVAAPSYGAVFRLVVAPAAPQNGILQMAGGQSGHFLSPHFRDQQADWLDGRPTPFLAGPTVRRIVLTP